MCEKCLHQVDKLYGMEAEMARTQAADAVSGPNRIRTLRKERGWSVYDLADALTTSGYRCAAATVSKAETGDRAVQRPMLEAVAKLFGVTPESLVISDSDPTIVRMVPIYSLDDAYRPGDDVDPDGHTAIAGINPTAFAIRVSEVLPQFDHDLRGIVVVDPTNTDLYEGGFYAAVSGRMYDLVRYDSVADGHVFRSATIARPTTSTATIIGRCVMCIYSMLDVGEPGDPIYDVEDRDDSDNVDKFVTGVKRKSKPKAKV